MPERLYTNEQGYLFLDKGSSFPYYCPKCGLYTKFYEGEIVTCAWCAYSGFPFEFQDVKWESGNRPN